MERNGLSCLGIIALVTIFIIVILGVEKCQDDNSDYQTKDNRGYNVEVIDSCEYLVRHSGYSGYMAHKGNCKFCEERRKKNENR